MKPFIRAAEIWLPAPDQSLLEFGSGSFGEALSFAAISRFMCFGRAEGLPGDAWEQGHPVLLKQFEGSHFRRIGAAKVAGLTCAVALPFFVANKLTAVLVLFGSDDQACTGAMELWRNDPRITSDMTLLDGYYGGMPAAFEQVSRDTYLPRGTGLPGLAWQRDEVVIMGKLSESTRFLRGDAANDAGICSGLALPCCSTSQSSYVLTLLSGQGTPIARRMERWVFDRQAERLILAGGHCDVQGDLAQIVSMVDLVEAPPGLAHVLSSGAPALKAAAQTMPGAMGQSAIACGARDCLWVPVLIDDKVTEVLALYL
jgi:hypothetical protein